MNFYDLVEDWCKGCKELRHDRMKDKRFYLCDGFLGMTDFMHEHTPEQSPCVLVDTSMSGILYETHDEPVYTLYFAVRAMEQNNDRAALMARLAGKQLANKFVAYLRWLKNSRYPSDKKYGSDYTLLERQEVVKMLDMKRIGYETLGPIYEGWHAVQLSLECPVMNTQCLDPNDYVEGWTG